MIAKSAASSHYVFVNNRHRKTLNAVFAQPVSGTVLWKDIESLLVAIGCTAIEGAGSRVRFALRAEIETFHRPHPAKEAKRYQVRATREYLIRLGIRPKSDDEAQREASGQSHEEPDDV